MIYYQNYKSHFITGFLIIILLNGCSNCRNSGKPNEIAQSPQKPKVEIPSKNQGIPNIGNSCYMNSVIQILTTFYRKAFERKQGALANAAVNMMNTIANQEKADPAKTKKKAVYFFNALKKLKQEGGIEWKPERGTQEDAGELLVKIFESLEIPNAETSYKLIHPITHAERWKTSPDPWSIWHIEIPTDKPALRTMQDFFNNSLAARTVEVNWTGYDTNNVEATEIPLLKNLDKLYGQILIISLKRFEFAKTASKINTYIADSFTFTIQKEQTADLTQDLHYELIGFIQHHGGVGGGHYVAYTKVDGTWIYYSDETVHEASATEVNSAAGKAYLFFYKQLKS